jgi:branched-chain amino acid transport system substrate-binding protein
LRPGQSPPPVITPNRMRRATYIHALALLLCAWVAGCASAPAKPAGDTLTVYASMPRHGVSARMAADVAAGARLALDDAGGRAGGKRVRLVALDSDKPGEETWDPSLVEANAKRAADDPTAIAYLGELDAGASAISVPVTNDKEMLEVSPADGLTSLTHDEPGAPLANSPERYYPSGRRTFLRLVPTDYAQAAALVGWARSRGARRLALLQDEQLSGRALAEQARYAAAKLGVNVVDVAEAHEDPTGYPVLAQRLAATRPDAVVYTGLADAESGRLLAAVHRALPGAALYGGSALATASPVPVGLPPTSLVKPALPVSVYGSRGRQVLARLKRRRGGPVGPEALYGYEAMRVVLDAIGSAGDDRAAVARAALLPRERDSVLGRYRVSALGDVSTTRFGAYRRTPGGLVWGGSRSPPGAAMSRP